MHFLKSQDEVLVSESCYVRGSYPTARDGPKLMTNTQNSTLRIHTPHLESTHSNTLSVKCPVSVISLGPGSRFFKNLTIVRRRKPIRLTLSYV